MNGYHAVKTFEFAPVYDVHGFLPPGWKPFAAFAAGERLYVVARKWKALDGKKA